MRYLMRRGKESLRRKVHLCGYDSRTGEPTMVPLCGLSYPFNMTSNVPWGLKVCKRCKRKESTP